MSTLTISKLLGTRLNTKTVLGFAIATAVGVFLAAYPLTCLGAVAIGVTVYALFRWCRAQMEWWQILVLLALTPSLILNYGFDNFAVGAGGFKFPLSDVLMFLALCIVAWRIGVAGLKNILLDPPIICLIALLVMTFFHLIFNIPRWGFYSVRDSSMFFESVILILGVSWAQNPRSTEFLKLWLFYVLLINLIYSYTFMWGEQIQYMSPKFGVFHPVPLVGNYQQTALWLLAGVIYFLWIAPQVVRWPRWILTLLAAAQLGGLAILQARSMYMGIGVILLLLFLFGETKRLVGFATAIGWGAGALFALLLTVSALGIQIEGRMGPVTFGFVEEQIETVFAMGNANTRMAHEEDRADWYGEVWGRLTSSAANMVVGEGFGQALISFVNDEGIPVREPHNSSLTVLARLGFVGLSIWLMFLGMIVVRYIRFLRMRAASPETHVTILWLFLVLVLYLMMASVQPTLEFSHGSMPFYFLIGLGIGIMGQKQYSFDAKRFGVRTPRTVNA
jgi:hypothetical protein